MTAEYPTTRSNPKHPETIFRDFRQRYLAVDWLLCRAHGRSVHRPAGVDQPEGIPGATAMTTSNRNSSSASIVKPRRLAEAHQFMMDCRPVDEAPVEAWISYRELGAKVYAEVADIDRYHYHEAMSWATNERNTAEKLRASGGSDRSHAYYNR